MPKNEVLLSFPLDIKLQGKSTWHWKYHKRKLEDLVVTNAKGEKLTDEQVKKALSKPTILLVSADGEPVHAYYLAVYKPETLVIIDKSPEPATQKAGE